MNDHQNENNLYNIFRGSGTNRRPRKDQPKEPEGKSSYLRNFQQKSKVDKDQMQLIFNETDNSMEKILNSSMSHLEKIIQGLEEPDKRPTVTVQEVLKQNAHLKESLSKLKKILKEKLQAELGKQRDQLSKIQQEYISLITKLLQDKNDLTNRLIERDAQIKEREHETHTKVEGMREANSKLKKELEKKSAELSNLGERTNELMVTIQQYEDEDTKAQMEFKEMSDKIKELEDKLAAYPKQETHHNKNVTAASHDSEHSFGQQQHRSEKYDMQETKIQTLIELLENSQQQNCKLREQIAAVLKSREEVKEQYETIIADLKSENEEQFIEYEKAVKETLDKKDDCIERLNIIIENLRSKKGLS